MQNVFILSILALFCSPFSGNGADERFFAEKEVCVTTLGPHSPLNGRGSVRSVNSSRSQISTLAISAQRMTAEADRKRLALFSDILDTTDLAALKDGASLDNIVCAVRNKHCQMERERLEMRQTIAQMERERLEMQKMIVQVEGARIKYTIGLVDIDLNNTPPQRHWIFRAFRKHNRELGIFARYDSHMCSFRQCQATLSEEAEMLAVAAQDELKEQRDALKTKISALCILLNKTFPDFQAARKTH